MPEYFYDKNNGYKVNYSGFVKNSFGDTYYHDETGRQVIGFKEIDGEFYYFTPGGASKYIRVASMEKIASSIIQRIKFTILVSLVKQLKTASSLPVEIGIISMEMLQQQLVSLKLMVKSFTLILEGNKLKVLLHQMVTTTMKSLVN